MTQEQGKTGAVRLYYWDEEGNRVHRARGKCKSGVWYTPMVKASDYDAALSRAETAERERDGLRAEMAMAKRREEAAFNIATDRTEEHIKFQKQRDELVALLDDIASSAACLAGYTLADALPRIHAALASIAKEQQT